MALHVVGTAAVVIVVAGAAAAAVAVCFNDCLKTPAVRRECLTPVRLCCEQHVAFIVYHAWSHIGLRRIQQKSVQLQQQCVF